MKTQLLRRPLPLLLATLLVACQAVPSPNPDLERARQAFNEANSNPYVSQQAGVELDRARQALSRAEQQWAKEHDMDETRHLAYLAQQRARIALEAGMARQAERQVGQAASERANMIANARTNQVQQAQAQTVQAQQQAANERERAVRLQQMLEQMSAKSTERGMVLTLSDVLFDVGRANLRAGGQATVSKLATLLRDYPERRVLIEGHTDSTGSTESNQTLSEARAAAVKTALQQQGIAAERIETRGYGETAPVADNKTAASRQQNRRVEILISNEQGQLKQR